MPKEEQIFHHIEDNDTTELTPFRFLDLPAELRDEIYLLYFNEPIPLSAIPMFLKFHRPDRPYERPITRVSRQVRAETLSVLYSNYTLAIWTDVKPSHPSAILLEPDTWYHKLHPEKIKFIRRFMLRYWMADSRGSRWRILELEITMSKRDGGSYGIYCSPNYAGFHRDSSGRRIIGAIYEHVTGTLDECVVQPGVGDFTTRELDRLTQIRLSES